MATAADRILANLPPTFAPLPRPTAISAIADAFGGELSQAENALAAVMFAHWVDFADTNVDVPTDLPLIAALYGLAPRDDETIEEFRAHLKRYIRTFIEGTVTVRGICRIVAEALGLVIADEYPQLDTWWSRGPHAALTTTDPAGDDAAALLFGTSGVAVRGVAAGAAAFAGTADLSAPIDLRGRSLLQIAVDGGAATTFDLASQLTDPSAADIGQIVAALAAFPGLVAASQNGRLVLRSATVGPSSTLELGNLPGDAVPAILGIAPHEFAGAAATQARIAGTVDLPATLDLTKQRYLRLTIDGKASFEIDCAAGNAAATTPAQVVAAIAVEAGAGIASLDGARLVLASPTTGLAGTIALSVPMAGDAKRLLLGDVATYARGSDAAPARVSGSIDLSAGIDLSERANLSLAIDAMVPVIVNCAGADPTKTRAGEIASAINAAVGTTVATQNGQTVTLTSKVVGPAGRIRLVSAPAGDALDLIFGFASRTATGTDARAATFTGHRDPVIPLDLRARQRLQIAIDDGAPVIVDFAAAGLARAGVQPAEIANAINAALGQAVATPAGANLMLTSGEPGEQGSVAIVPIETARARPFVSRAFSVDEASNAVLGRFMAEAQGAGGTVGSLTGAVDLHDGLDLRTKRFLRLSVDGGPPRDIDCAACSVRPYAALLPDIVKAINQASALSNLASIDNDRLVLISPTAGAASAVTLGANAGDASRVIFGFDPKIVTGTDARRLVFTGLVDLSKRIDLSAADRVKLAIDGGAAVEVACAGLNPATTSAAEIVLRINTALGGSYASTDGTYLRLSSALAGNASIIEFLAPAQQDATRAIFGIRAGRTYHGDDPTPATLVGAHDLATTLDLTVTALVRLAVDGGAPVLIDCRGQSPETTTPAEIVTRINAALGPSVVSATMHGGRISVAAASTGAASRIALQAADDGDARSLLLGDAESQPGRDPSPATLKGDVDLGQPVDLSRRSILRLAIDGGRPVDIDLSGAAPDRTFGDEIVAAISKQLPGVASLDNKGHLVLASPSAGEDSSIAVQPLRSIEVIEYPPSTAQPEPQQVKNGGTFTLKNDGAADATVAFTISSASGLCGVDLIGLSIGQRIHIDAVAGDNESITIAPGRDGRIEAAVVDANGVRVPIAPDRITATPSRLAVEVPFDGPRPLATGERGSRPALTLVDPLAGNTVVIEQAGVSPSVPAVRVVSADPAATSAPPNQPAGRITLIGRVRATDRSGELQDAAGTPIARVRAAKSLAPFDGQMVVAIGTWYSAGAASLLAVETIARVFDVTVDGVSFPAVTIDARAGARSLSACLSAPGGPPLIARDAAPSEALRLPRGRSDWMVVQCDSARFDAAYYDSSRFAGGTCVVPGIFNVSRFNAKADEGDPHAALSGELARFNPLATDRFLTVSATWQSHRPGAFVVNLPADLPDSFGARFNAARFASQSEEAEAYAGIVLDPQTDPGYIGTVLANTNGKSLVRAQWVSSVPLGWEPQVVPFAQPRRRYLTGGRADRPSALYLQQRGVAGAFGVFARDPGAWGNQISITVRFAAPAIFDLTVSHAAARFECARVIALAGRVLKPGEVPLPALTAEVIKPGPVGAVQAKAAGIHATVTRERA
jgi:hypothetical protein